MQRGKLEKRTKALADKALAYLKEKKGATSNTEIRVKAFCDSFAPFFHTDTCTEEVKLEILETLKKYRNEADPDPLTDDLAYYKEILNPDGSLKAGWETKWRGRPKVETVYTTADGEELTLEEYRKRFVGK